MKLNEAKYMRRFNLGDYQHEEYSLSCVAEDEDTGKELLQELKNEVLEAHTENNKEKGEGKNAKSSNSKNGNKDGSSPRKETKGSKDESSKDDEASNVEAGDNDNNQSEGNEVEDGSSEGKDSEESEEQEKSSKGKNSSKGKVEGKETTKKSFKRKPQQYDRSIEAHKEIFSRILRTIDANWKENPDFKKKAKKVSEKLEHEDFLDENGEVLEDFKKQVKKEMK